MPIRKDNVISTSFLSPVEVFEEHFLRGVTGLVQIGDGSQGAISSDATASGVWQLGPSALYQQAGRRTDFAFIAGRNEVTFSVRARMPTIATTNEDFEINIAIANKETRDYDQGIGFFWNYGKPNVTASAGVSEIDTGLFVTQNRWYTYEINLSRVNYSFWITDETTGAIVYQALKQTTNFPVQNTFLACSVWIQKFAGTAQRNLQLDIFRYGSDFRVS